MEKCLNCKEELRSTSKFCVNCGTKIGDIANNNEKITNKKEVENDSSNDLLDRILNYLYDYAYFLKQVLVFPTSVFTDSSQDSISGGISLFLLSYLFATNAIDTYYAEGNIVSYLIKYFLLHSVIVGILFLLTKYLTKEEKNIYEIIYYYGGIASSQLILLFLLKLIDGSSGLGVFILLITYVNQHNIFFLYANNLLKQSKNKMDKYYQLIMLNIPFVIINSYIFKDLLTEYI